MMNTALLIGLVVLLLLSILFNAIARGVMAGGGWKRDEPVALAIGCGSTILYLFALMGALVSFVVLLVRLN